MTEIVVLGAGIVGVTTALELQSRGHAVVVIDRVGPGLETSYGNAGIIQREAPEPFAIPRTPGLLFNLLSGHSNDLAWRLRAVIEQMPALWSYFRNSAPGRLNEIAVWHRQLMACVNEDHARWFEAAGAEALILKNGFGFLYRDTKSFDTKCADLHRLESEFGITSQVLTGDDLRAAEPMITGELSGAILWPQTWTCSSPGGLTRSYADYFQSQGGVIHIGDALSLEKTGHGWRVRSDDGEVSAEKAIVALGPWTPDLLARHGYKVSMIKKFGYHRHHASKQALTRPYLDLRAGVVASSMGDRLRITSGVSLETGRDKPNLHQIDRGVGELSDIIALWPAVEEKPWRGARPFVPDMLPVIGQAPKDKGLWFNFGHGHHGFTTGPTTARLLADALQGQTSQLLARLSPADRVTIR